MTITIWLLTGAGVGFIASRIMKTKKDFLGYMLLGIIGGGVGGWVLNGLFKISFAGFLGSIITSVIGSIIVILIVRLIRKQ